MAYCNALSVCPGFSLGPLTFTLACGAGVFGLRLHLRPRLRQPEDYVQSVRTLLPSSEEMVKRARSLQWAPVERIKNHPHGLAAALRIQAKKFADNTATALGLERFDASLAARDRGCKGMREVHDQSDLAVDFLRDTLPPNPLVTFIDTIEHMSLQEVGQLCKGAPFLAYQSAPRGPAGVPPDARYAFVSEDTFKWQVFGGRVYEHGSWVFPDTFMLEHDPERDLRPGFLDVKFPWASNRTVTTLYQTVEYRQPDCEDKHIVIAVPRASFSVSVRTLQDTLSALGRRMDFARPTRLRVNVIGPVAVTGSLESGDATARLAFLGDLSGHVVEIPMPAWIALRHASSHKDFQFSDINRTLKSLERRERSAVELQVIAAAVCVDAGPRYLLNYTVVGGCRGLDVSQIGKPVAALAAPPLVAPAVAAADCINNRTASGELRLAKLLNAHNFTFEQRERAQEFVEALVSNPGKGAPVDLTEVLEVQNSAAQRVRQAKARVKVTHVLKPQAFQKKEAGEAGAPRNIVALDQGSNQRLAQFVYAFKRDVMSEQQWFYPGLAPVALVQRLKDWYQSLAPAGDKGVNHGEGDYSKLDATISADMRQHVLHAAMLRWVASEYRAELEALLEAETDLKIWFSPDLKVSPGGAILSGSANTSVFGTLANAFVQYLAWRQSGLLPADAYARIGVCFGDDSVVEHGPDYVRAAADLGMVLKYNRSERQGEFSFLSRSFAVDRTIGSVPHLIRRLSKLPVVTNKKLGAHRYKVMGHLAVDSSIPVLSEYLHALARIGGYASARPDPALYVGRGDLNWMVQQGPYPVDAAFEAFALECACRELDLTPADVARLRAKLSAVETPEELAELLIPHLCEQPESKLIIERH